MYVAIAVSNWSCFSLTWSKGGSSLHRAKTFDIWIAESDHLGTSPFYLSTLPKQPIKLNPTTASGSTVSLHRNHLHLIIKCGRELHSFTPEHPCRARDAASILTETWPANLFSAHSTSAAPENFTLPRISLCQSHAAGQFLGLPQHWMAPASALHSVGPLLRLAGPEP